MLWIRAFIFTLLAPVLVGVGVPYWIEPDRALRGGVWSLGWILIACGAALYLHSLRRFLAAGGTPAIFFARHLRALIGEEPRALVQSGLYRRSRNPMYLGVTALAAGQAVLFASQTIALYAGLLAVFFHFIVTTVEEPHLRTEHGARYEEYARQVPRWL